MIKFYGKSIQNYFIMIKKPYLCADLNLITMAQVSMTVRMDSQLKQRFDALCAEFGMSANTAMNIFAKAVVQRGKIPFEIRSERETVLEESYDAFKAMRRRAENGETPDLTMEEIDEEIRKARATR